MAHPCFNCGNECYCHGDVDDVITCNTPAECDGCGCCMNDDEEDDYEVEDELEDGIPAAPCNICKDFEACQRWVFMSGVELAAHLMIEKRLMP